MEASLRFYFDENMPVVIALQLKRRGIEAVTVRDLGLLGDEDINHLKNAAELGYVRLATEGIEHAGIVFGQQDKHSIGDWVENLSLMHAVYSAEEMQNRLEYL